MQDVEGKAVVLSSFFLGLEPTWLQDSTGELIVQTDLISGSFASLFFLDLPTALLYPPLLSYMAQAGIHWWGTCLKLW